MKKLLLIASLMGGALIAEEKKPSAALEALDAFDTQDQENNSDEQLGQKVGTLILDNVEILFQKLKSEIKNPEELSRLTDLVKLIKALMNFEETPEFKKQLDLFEVIEKKGNEQIYKLVNEGKDQSLVQAKIAELEQEIKAKCPLVYERKMMELLIGKEIEPFKNGILSTLTDGGIETFVDLFLKNLKVA